MGMPTYLNVVSSLGTFQTSISNMQCDLSNMGKSQGQNIPKTTVTPNYGFIVGKYSITEIQLGNFEEL